MKRQLPIARLIHAFAITILLCGGLATAQEHVRISSGSLTGTWYPLGMAIGEAIATQGLTFENNPGGGVSNVVAIGTDQAELGLTMTVILDMAAQGEAPFPESYDNLMAIAALHPDPAHILVAADSGIEEFVDLKGKRIAVAEVGQTSRMVFDDLLRAHGMTTNDVTIRVGSPGEALTLYKDRHVDAWIYVMPPPSPQATEMFISRDSRFISLSDESIAALQALRSGYSATVIPAGTYPGQDDDVVALNTAVVIAASADLSEEVGYRITAGLVENIKLLRQSLAVMQNLTPEEMADLAGLQVHPGAARYYEENGYSSQ